LRNSTETNTKDNQKMAEISNNQKLTLVEVRANWSGGSHLMDLIVNRIEKQFDSKIRVVKIDFETHREFLFQFGVESAPAIFLLRNGQVVEVINETLSQKNLEALVHIHMLNDDSIN
jgi:thioredoxin 1